MKLSLRFALLLPVLALLSGCGDSAIKRHMTVSGIYSVCKPDGYPVVCFLDADGKDGGMFCMKLADVGGECR